MGDRENSLEFDQSQTASYWSLPLDDS